MVHILEQHLIREASNQVGSLPNCIRYSSDTQPNRPSIASVPTQGIP